MTYYRYRFSFGYGLTPVIKNLMIIMGARFSPSKNGRNRSNRVHGSYYFNLHLSLALVPILVWKKYFLWQLVTYIFLHGGISPPSLQSFSPLDVWGRIRKLLGIEEIFTIFFLLRNRCRYLHGALYSYPYQFIPVIGASGAIYGILLAFGWLFPNRLIYIYFLFPIPAKYMVIIFGLIEFFSSIEGTGGGIAHLTHLGGLLFGLIYMAYPTIRQKIRREYYKRKWSQKGPGGGDYYH